MNRIYFTLAASMLMILGAQFFLDNVAALFGGGGSLPVPLVAEYMAASFGAAAIAWGWILLRAARDPALARVVSVPTAVGLALLGMQRLATLPQREAVLDFFPSAASSAGVLGAEAALSLVLAWGVWRARSA